MFILIFRVAIDSYDTKGTSIKGESLKNDLEVSCETKSNSIHLTSHPHYNNKLLENYRSENNLNLFTEKNETIEKQTCNIFCKNYKCNIF